MNILETALASLLTTEENLTNNPVANFAYTQTAYVEDTADGVESYNARQEQNIPLAKTSTLKVSEAVLLKGYRSQASSMTRMLVNHFFGRTSYNLNKIHDKLLNFFRSMKDSLGQAKGLATTDYYYASDNSVILLQKNAEESIATNMFKTNAVREAKLDSLSVTESKFSDSAVDTLCIANLNVKTNNFADSSVTEDKILDNSIMQSKLATSSVTTSALDLSSVTPNKLNLLTKTEDYKEGQCWLEAESLTKEGSNIIYGSDLVDMNNIVKGNNVFVAIGNSGRSPSAGIICYSTDGKSWEIVKESARATAYGLIFTGAYFYCTLGAYVFRSADGTLWEQVFESSLNAGRTCAYMSNKILYSNYTNLWLITDVNSASPAYSQVTISSSYTYTRIHSLFAENGKFFINLYDNNSRGAYNSYISSSEDGINWSEFSSISPSSTLGIPTINSIAHSESIYIAVGIYRTTYPIICTSTDGEHWAVVASDISTGSNTAIPSGIGAPLYDVIYADGKFVAGGGYDALTVALTSIDGSNWENLKRGSSVGQGRIVKLFYTGKLFVAVSGDFDYPTASIAGSVCISSDATTWTEVTTTHSSNGAVLADNYSVVTVGIGKTGNYARTTNYFVPLYKARTAFCAFVSDKIIEMLVNYI